MFLLAGCGADEPVDLSEFTAVEPPTRTPVPTPTKVVSKPGTSNKLPDSNDLESEQAIDLIAQLDKIYERLTGIEQFDLNSDMFNQFDGAIQAAIIKINDIAQSGGSDTETQVAYQQAIEELLVLANVGKGEVVSVHLAKVGGEMKSASVQNLAQSFKDADAGDISAELGNLAENISEISTEELDQIATDLIRAANEIAPAASAVQEMLSKDVLDPDLEASADIASQLIELAQAIQAGNVEGMIEKLRQLQQVIDAIAPNLELTQFLASTIENVEKETIAERDLASLFSGEGNIRISQVEINVVKTSRKQALSSAMIPAITPSESTGQVCILSVDKIVLCLNEAAEWVSPATLAPFNGRVSAFTICNDQILLATDKELVSFKNNVATPFGSDGFPFKSPSQLVCDSANGIWALPAPDLADSPWFYKDEVWVNHSTILQNTIGVHSLNIPWGTKFEVNEKSVVRNGKPIDHIPFITRFSLESWDIYYNVYWETGLWGAVTDENGEMWFPGSALYHLDHNQRWYGFEANIGPAFTLLSNDLMMGINASTGRAQIFDGTAVWWQLSDWPEEFSADMLKTDESGRVFAAGESGILVWDGEYWDLLPNLTESPLDFIIVEDDLVSLN